MKESTREMFNTLLNRVVSAETSCRLWQSKAAKSEHAITTLVIRRDDLVKKARAAVKAAYNQGYLAGEAGQDRNFVWDNSEIKLWADGIVIECQQEERP